MTRPSASGERWFRTSSPVLIGRGDELAALRAAVLRRPAVVLVEGEAGVGKSRLLQEVLDVDLGPVLPLVGYCRQIGEPFSYGAVLEALRGGEDRLARRPRLSPVTGVLASLLPEIAEYLPPPLAPIGDPRAERHRLFRAVRELVTSFGPVLLAVEDLQWADHGTRELLRFLMSDPPADLTVVVTYRREDLPGGSPLGAEYRPPAGVAGVVVELGPLSVDEVRELTLAILGEDAVWGEDAVSADFAVRLHERTAGIPFVVEETLRSLRGAADLTSTVSADGVTARKLLDAVAVPVLLRDAMAERLAALPTAAARLAAAAAVLGVPAPPELLGEVGGVPEPRLRRALTHALDSYVLYEVDSRRYGFRHSLARQAVYDTISAPDRAHLHDRAVDALDQVEPRPLVQLAEHSERAGRVAAWLAFGEAAADRATETGDAATATALLQRLLTVSVLPADVVNRLATKLGQIAHTGLDQFDPAETLERLLDDPRLSTSVRGEVRLYRALLLIRRLGRLREARAQFERAIGELDERPELVARAAAVLSLPYHGMASPAEVAQWRRCALGYRESATGELLISLLANETSAISHAGHPIAPLLDLLPAQPAAIGAQQHLARLRCNVADSLTWRGHLERAREILDDGLRLATDSGAPFLVSTGRTTEARLDWLTGAWKGLAGRARRLTEEYRDLTAMTSELELVLGWLAVTRGDWNAAAAHFGRTGAHMPEEAITPVAVAGCAGLAWNLLSQESPADAVVEADRGLDIVRHKESWPSMGELLPVAVAAYLSVGRVADATGLIDETAAGLGSRDAPLVSAALAQSRGRVAEHGDDLAGAVGHYRDARERYERLPAPYFAAVVAEREATCLTPTDADKAVGLLSTLADAYDGLGATRDAARCRHRLHSLGPVTPVRRGRRGYGNDLSPREVEVARLLTAGHTNREIAGLLFLSQRTVEQHVARLFRKLGISSRTQLRAQDLG